MRIPFKTWEIKPIRGNFPNTNSPDTVKQHNTETLPGSSGVALDPDTGDTLPGNPVYK